MFCFPWKKLKNSWWKKNKVHPLDADNDVLTTTERSSNTWNPVVNPMSSDVSMDESETVIDDLTVLIYEEIFLAAETTNDPVDVDIQEVAAELYTLLELYDACTSTSWDMPDVDQKQRGGSPLSGEWTEDMSPTDGPRFSVPTLSPAREQQLMSRGLMNFGNSCYVNASLQCLFSVDSFCTQLSCQASNWIYSPSAQLIRWFIELYWMKESDDWGMKASLLMEMIDAAAATNSDFTVDVQNDAHEFLFHILNQMEQDGQKLGWAGGGAECPIRANFGFQLQNVITCRSCGVQKFKKDDFSHLSLALPRKGSVNGCLQHFFSVEEEIECRCDVCGCNSACSRWAFHTLPRILVLQMKRFKVSAASIKKRRSQLHIDPKLQLTPQVQILHEDHGYKQSMPSDALEKRTAEETETGRKDQPVERFSLVSVLNHFGCSLDSGHYLSDCSCQSDSCWLSYNDQSVTFMTEEQVVKQRQSSAYVLFYQRDELSV